MESTGAFLAVVTPLIVVPLTAITFYLRAMKENQDSGHSELMRRVERFETSLSDVRNAVSDFERDYTTKEEWLRETMLARQTLQQLQEASVRLETMMDTILSGREKPALTQVEANRVSMQHPVHSQVSQQ